MYTHSYIHTGSISIHIYFLICTYLYIRIYVSIDIYISICLANEDVGGFEVGVHAHEVLNSGVEAGG
jgi:hypothetical protein